MEVCMRIEANEIEQVKELTYYNNVMWKFIRPNRLGITHFNEKFDDICENYVRYEFGILEEGKFKYMFDGEGKCIPEKEIGCGGIWTEVHISYPEYMLNAKIK